MSLFVWDTAGDQDLLSAKQSKSKLPFNGNGPLLSEPSINDDIEIGSEEEDDGDYGGLPPPCVDISKILKKSIVTEKPKTKVEMEMDYAVKMVQLAENNKPKTQQKQPRFRIRPDKDIVFSEQEMGIGKSADSLTETNVAVEMLNSNVGLEKEKSLPRLRDKVLRDLRRAERSKTKGDGWFNMGATEVTEEVENDLKILQMRSVLNPKHFYKKNDLKVLPKFFQIGTVMHSPLDYYKERDTRRNKKKTLVDELLADAEFQKYTKRKFKEVTARNDKYAHKKAMKKMKKLKKNK